VILLPELKDRFAAGSVAQRILKRLEQPFNIKDTDVFITTSIGIATFPEDGHTAEELVRNADTAMYHAKQQGKAAYQYYSAAMNAASVERLTLERGLRRALDGNLLELHYQPQVDAQSGRIVGAEALLRWNDSVRGYIPPATFIPVAEDSGWIAPIGEWVLLRACRQAVEWQRAGLPAIPVAVNVSGVQFRRQDVCELVKRALDVSGLDPAMLCIEITETSLMSVKDRAVPLLQQLREMGVGVALDDFGTGYSSLSYLKTFPINLLKIDKSFIAGVLTDRTTASITEAVITMTRILGLRVLAEGVENEAQLEFLKKRGCDLVQGFLFSAALPADQFSALLTSPNARKPHALSAASST
jgi:EAL domain-containing protein (putative c-di-GMP-specific phosphodiesterase class I)